MNKNIGKLDENHDQVDLLNKLSNEIKEMVLRMSSLMKSAGMTRDNIIIQKNLVLKVVHDKIEEVTNNSLHEIDKCSVLLQEKIKECSNFSFDVKKEKEAAKNTNMEVFSQNLSVKLHELNKIISDCEKKLNDDKLQAMASNMINLIIS